MQIKSPVSNDQALKHWACKHLTFYIQTRVKEHHCHIWFCHPWLNLALIWDTVSCKMSTVSWPRNPDVRTELSGKQHREAALITTRTEGIDRFSMRRSWKYHIHTLMKGLKGLSRSKTSSPLVIPISQFYKHRLGSISPPMAMVSHLAVFTGQILYQFLHNL